jgi:DNA topoisomerase IA
VRWTTWWASTCRRCCGASCRAARARPRAIVALRLICEREAEIEAFVPREYWTVQARMATPSGAPFTARLTHHEGKRLDQFDLSNEALAMAAKAAVEAAAFSVGSVEKKRVKRNPPAPFQTSTLQQEASRKLGFGAQVTMRTAQSLYEGVEIGGETVGLISYMRTDGVQMAREAIAEIRGHIKSSFGEDYIPARRANTPRAPRTRRRPTRPSGRPMWGARRRRWRATCPTSSASSTS